MAKGNLQEVILKGGEVYPICRATLSQKWHQLGLCKMKKKKKQKLCCFCEVPLTWSSNRVYCDAPECVEKFKDRRRKQVRKVEAKRRLKMKRERIKKNPKDCIHCGNAMGIKDDFKLPVCNECLDWWEENKPKFKKERERKYQKKLAEQNKAEREKRAREDKLRLERIAIIQNRKPKNVDTEDEWSQDHYDVLQEFLEKPNGRKCQWWKNFGGFESCGECQPDSPAELVGNDRLYCKEHQEKLKNISSRTDDLYLYDGEAYGGYDAW